MKYGLTSCDTYDRRNGKEKARDIDVATCLIKIGLCLGRGDDGAAFCLEKIKELTGDTSWFTLVAEHAIEAEFKGEKYGK